MSDSVSAEHAPAAPGLQRGILTIPNAVALSAAAMAPVLAVVLNAPAAASAAGAALPLSFLIAFIACALVGNTVVQFSRKLPSAGSFYTFNRAGLGPAAGFFTGWLFWIGYAILAPGLFTAFGAFVHDYLLATFAIDVHWWVCSMAGMVVVFGLSVRSIKASVNVDLALLVVEVLVFLLLGIIAIATAGSGNSQLYFTTSVAPAGVAGVGVGVVFGILSFIGFDAAATLGEETINPRRSIPLAITGALGAVGLFYVLMMYALAAGYGLNDAGKLAAFLHDANPFVTLAARVTPRLLHLVELAAIAGLFSCFLAIHNTTVRVMFAMGRDGILPSSMGKIHANWYSPLRAIIAQTVFTIVIGTGVGLWLGPGATGSYGFSGTIGTVAIVMVYLMSNIALIRYFWSHPERQVLTHVVVPTLGVAVLIYPLYSVANPLQPYPFNLVPIIVLAWVLAGLVLYLVYRARSPEKIAALGSFIAADDLPAERCYAMEPRMKKLDGRIAVITGAASGIGRGIAVAFAREGAHIVVADQVHESAAAVVLSEIAEAGTRGLFVQTDVSDEASVRHMADVALREFGRVDILVNNAGIFTESLLEDISVEDWDRVVNTNLRGTFLCTRVLIGQMLARRDGRIINIASQLGQIGGTSVPHYVASKAGVIGLTKALAREVAGRGVLVNAIAPGPIETPLLDSETEAWRRAKLAELPVGRFGRVDEVTPTAVLLASADGSYYVGQTLGPNGGDVML